jgi:hypothetical protein
LSKNFLCVRIGVMSDLAEKLQHLSPDQVQSILSQLTAKFPQLDLSSVVAPVPEPIAQSEWRPPLPPLGSDHLPPNPAPAYPPPEQGDSSDADNSTRKVCI